MKTIGLIGGMSWESTTLYYQHLNRMARERLGGQSSASLVMVSLDFAPIARMQAAGLWDELTVLMIDAARRLERAGAESVVICANTMHRMADEVASAVSVPLVHVADATAGAVRQAGAKRPLLLATRYTMEQPFYRDRLRRRGVEALVPAEPDRVRLQSIIFDELVQGRFKLASKDAVVAMVESAVRGEGVDAVILGCTEFGLLVTPDDLPVTMFDTAELHAAAAMDFALSA
ncbi:MAG TPA: aspartate/glutamate racemase family protein [Caulobacteraceae bacterium]|jgi:aspartate racemase|nr:aspartate/glutamate racemase family protein [Caulobacteraceae bacterium]